MLDSKNHSSFSKRLRELLYSNPETILMEAHNALSAKIAAEAGFEALWGSGLSISAALGLRDSNEASWTQVLEVLEFMVDAARIPILMDGDTGYGNFNNVRRLVRKLEQRSIAGVCLEDKLFPKTNSFINGEQQTLAEPGEFCGKIRAAKDTQQDPDFVVVARTEALIAGRGLGEALARACAYAEAGADAVLIHSKRKDGKEIFAFAKEWDAQVPLIIVPTKYPSEPLSGFAAAGIKNFIYANQSLRTVITALQRNLTLLRKTQSLMSIEHDIAPVSEVFRLQDVDELSRSEEMYLPNVGGSSRSALLLLPAPAAVEDSPAKGSAAAMHDRSLLARHAEAFRRCGIQRLNVVCDPRDCVVGYGDMRHFTRPGGADHEVESLRMARETLTGDVIISSGRTVFDHSVLHRLVTEGDGITVLVDTSWAMRRGQQRPVLAETNGVNDPLCASRCRLVHLGGDVEPARATGEWTGLLYVPADKLSHLLEQVERLADSAAGGATLVDIINGMLSRDAAVDVVHTYGHSRSLDEAAAESLGLDKHTSFIETATANAR